MEQIALEELKSFDLEISQRFGEEEILQQEIKQYYIKQNHTQTHYYNILDLNMTKEDINNIEE